MPNSGPVDHRVKLKESEKRDKYQDLARELNKTIEHKNGGDINGNWSALNNHQRIGRGSGGLGNKKTSRDHSEYNIIKISQNTEKSFCDMRRLVVTQTAVEDHQIMPAGKTLEGVILSLETSIEAIKI